MSIQKLKDFNKQFTPQYLNEIKTTIGSFSHKEIQSQLMQSIQIAEHGKKIRPFLCKVMDDPNNSSLHTSIYQSLELIHLFALIHDDIMDECDSRRGQITIHANSRKFYPNQNPQKQNRITESIAILAGDLIFSLAEKQFQTSLTNISKQKWQKAYHFFNQLKEEVIYGQLLDLHLTSTDSAKPEDVYKKTFYKTASYTIIKPMQIGCVLADREDLIDFCSEFGEPLGVAFQIQDDYLNLTRSQAETGKPQFTDILENQKTYFFLQLQDDPKYMNQIQKFIGKDSLTPEEELEIKDILQASGVLDQGLQKFTELYQESIQILNQNKDLLQEETYQTLLELSQYLINRTN